MFFFFFQASGRANLRKSWMFCVLDVQGLEGDLAGMEFGRLFRCKGNFEPEFSSLEDFFRI